MHSMAKYLDSGKIFNDKIAYCDVDMMSLSSLGPATIAIVFDKAFPPVLLDHIMTIMKKSLSLQGAVFFKPSKVPKYIKMIEDKCGMKWVHTVHEVKKMVKQ